jgi:hypothetical protein
MAIMETIITTVTITPHRMASLLKLADQTTTITTEIRTITMVIMATMATTVIIMAKTQRPTANLLKLDRTIIQTTRLMANRLKQGLRIPIKKILLGTKVSDPQKILAYFTDFVFQMRQIASAANLLRLTRIQIRSRRITKANFPTLNKSARVLTIQLST